MNQGRQMQMVVVNAGNQGNRKTQNARIRLLDIMSCKMGIVGIHKELGVGPYGRNYINKNRVKDLTYYIERLMLVQQEEADASLIIEKDDFLAYASDEEREEGTYVEQQYDRNIIAEILDMDFSGETCVLVNHEAKAANERLIDELA
ncbi:hypothetical protein Tco_0434775 [Tanacetum coccineum]